MNLHGYLSKEAVIEDAYGLWQSLRLVFDGKRWKWSVHRSHPSFAGTVAKPFDQVLRAEGLNPEKLHQKFAGRAYA